MTGASHARPEGADTVVVGAGVAGCVVARRLADAGRQVLLLEAGNALAPPVPGLLDIGPGSRVIRRHPGLLDGIAIELPRGQTPGGSGAVNGGYCLPARPSDLERWPAGWGSRYLCGLARAVERLRPCLVPLDPVADWVARAFPSSVQRIPQARVGRPGGGLRRVTPLTAWDPVGAGARLLVGTQVRELKWEGAAGGRCTGVRLTDGHEIEACEVWLTAGALATAEVLAASGIGPATGHPVGESVEEHAEILLDLPETIPGFAELASQGPGLAPLLSGVCRLTISGQQVEVRPYSVPMHRAIPGLDAQPHRIGIALMSPYGRGALRPAGDGSLIMDLSAYPDPRDAAALSAAVAVVRDRLDIAGPEITSTSHHLAGTARIGEVTDEDGRLLGATGIRIADGSVLPSLPACGPYLSIAAVAEALAESAT